MNSTAHHERVQRLCARVVHRVAKTFWYSPRAETIEAMRRAGVTHVMVHPARFRDPDAIVAGISATPELELMAVGSRGLRLYRLH